jgi:DNA-directed RNA polymerase subunit RPC12/RpoP
MAEYKCFSCNKQVDSTYIKKRIRCPYCGAKILFKERLLPTVVKAR